MQYESVRSIYPESQAALLPHLFKSRTPVRTANHQTYQFSQGDVPTPHDEAEYTQ